MNSSFLLSLLRSRTLFWGGCAALLLGCGSGTPWELLFAPVDPFVSIEEAGRLQPELPDDIRLNQFATGLLARRLMAYASSQGVFVSREGSAFTKVADVGGTPGTPLFSPNGQHLAWTEREIEDEVRPGPGGGTISHSSNAAAAATRLRWLDLAATSPQTVAEHLSNVGRFQQAPDGTALTFISQNTGLSRLNWATGEVSALVEADVVPLNVPPVKAPASTYEGPSDYAWKPDGTAIAFQVAQSLKLLTLADRSVKTLRENVAFPPSYRSILSWAPSGDTVWVIDTNQYEWIGIWRHTPATDADDFVRITPSLPGQYWEAELTPDRTHLMATRREGSPKTWHAYTIRLTDGLVTDQGPGNYTRTWFGAHRFAVRLFDTTPPRTYVLPLRLPAPPQ